MRNRFRRSLSPQWASCASRILVEYRKAAALTLRETAKRSGIGMGVISALEHRARTATMTLYQLLALLRVYRRTLADFERDLCLELDATGTARKFSDTLALAGSPLRRDGTSD